MIHLGYETGTGKPVGIPLAHMAVTGQTQQSGKTTTLEALIDRGDLRAVVFITKPGEKSFSDGRRILPFFKERADWEYVKELLESRRNESLSKWDGYLMRVCRKARTLQDVRDNVEEELPKKRSARPSHYEVLAGYLDLIIPELERIPYADKVDLRPGVNIMDLTGMSDEMQSLVLRSTIEHIHKSERNTVLVLPEAWKFIPEGGRSSVFQALHGLIREGATNGNYVWIDAQDLAIVSKRILKSVTVWVLGKQQEANEVARTINHLIEPLHIRPDMIKSLGIGQFLVCGEGITKRVYVQPRWLGELDALAIARGEESVETAQAIWRQKKRDAARMAQGSKNHGESKTEIVAGTVEGIPPVAGADVQNRGRTGSKVNDSDSPEPATPARTGRIVDGEKPNELSATGSGLSKNEVRVSTAMPASHGDDRRASGDVGDPVDGADPAQGGGVASKNRIDVDGDEAMWKEAYEKLQAEHQTLIEAHDALAARVGKLDGGHYELTDKGKEVVASLNAGNGIQPVGFTVESMEVVYGYVKARCQKDPGILQLLASRPELRIEIERPVLEVEGKTLRGGLALLIHRGFFAAPKNGNAAFNELQRLGRKVAKRTTYDELDRLAELGFLTKEDSGYQATDLKVTVAK